MYSSKEELKEVELREKDCISVTHLNSALGGTPSSYQMHFTISIVNAAQANHLTVSCQYEREPPFPRSTPWGACRSASHKQHRSSLQSPSVLPFTHTLNIYLSHTFKYQSCEYYITFIINYWLWDHKSYKFGLCSMDF